MKVPLISTDIYGKHTTHYIEVEVSTADLIAELEKRRHELCPKCANGKSVLCVECVWAGVYRAYRKDDNFKPSKEEK